jgi:flagellar hook-associated protein FlgK
VSDLLSLGSGAISVYKQALATVSNNIANVNNEGYSRQTVSISQNQPVQAGTSFLGTGARLASIEREFDAFTEQQLRVSTSDLAAQKPLVEYAGRILDRFAAKDSALSGAMDRFFSSLSALSADASSLSLREIALSDAALLGDRFQALDAFLDDQAAGSEADLSTTVAEINALAQELGGVNQKLSRRDALSKQPPALLDERDQLLRDLSERVRLDVSEASSGEVTVRLGNSAGAGALISGGEVRILGLQLDPIAEDRATFYLEPVNPSQGRLGLSGVSGGTLGGLVTFREQVLEPTRSTLDTLARGLVEELNRFHQSGMGLDGETGRVLFALKPDYQLVGLDALRGFSLETQLENPDASVVDNFELRYDPALQRWLARVPATLEGPEREVMADDDGVVRLDGVGLRVEGNSSSAVTLQVRGTKGGAGDVVLSLTRAEHFGAADPLRVRGEALNSQAARASVTFQEAAAPLKGPLPLQAVFPNNTDPSAGRALTGGSSPITVLPSGSEGAELRLSGTMQSTTQFRVMTREGVLLSGPALSEAEQAALIQEDNGFASRARYRAQDPAEPYRDLSLEAGAFALESAAGGFRLDGDRGIRVAADGGLSDATTNALRDGALQFNGSVLSGALPVNGAGRSSAVELATWLNGQAALQEQGVQVSAETRLVFANFDLNAGAGLTINGQEIVAPGGGIVASDEALVSAINDASGATGVFAQLGREGELILRNNAGQEGASIALGGQVQVPGDDNILGSTGIFGGALSVRGGDRFSLTLAETGSPNLLADLGWDTRLQVGGQQRDDLLLFLAGDESVTVSASYGQSDFDPLASLREQPLEVRFLDGGERYVILEQNSETELATGRFVPGAAIRYGGAVLTFDGQPAGGDRFFIEDNRDGVDDNRNLKRLAQLADSPISALGDKSGADYYASLASRVGTLSRQAVIGEQALEVVKAQAEEARDRISGVSLDQEAADLIRYQQAYQAAAKIIQTSQDLFDAVLAI